MGLSFDERMREILAGLTIFATMSYIVFAVPGVLTTIGAPFFGVALGTCLITAITSISAGYYAKVPAAIAPGMAIVGLVTSFVASDSNDTLTWEGALLCCSIAGFFFFLMSVEGFRTRLIESLPKPIIFAISGGIGALLADKAIQLSGLENSAVYSEKLVFTAGISVIVIGFIITRTMAARLACDPDYHYLSRYIDLAGRSSLLISVIVAASAAHLSGMAATKIGNLDGAIFAISDVDISFIDAMSQLLSPEAIVLTLVIMYILLSDFVGSPYQLLMRGDGSAFSTHDLDTIQHSFRIDSFSNIWTPIFGVTSAVYYAENNAGKVAGGKTGLTAITVGVCFAAVAVLLIFLRFLGFQIQNLIPAESVAPVLFFVGIYIIASSVVPYRDENDSMSPTTGAIDDDVDVERRMPAALTIVLTPVLGFEYAIAAGLALFYFYFIIFTNKYERELMSYAEGRSNVDASLTGSLARLHFLALLAMIALFVKVMTGS